MHLRARARLFRPVSRVFFNELATGNKVDGNYRKARGATFSLVHAYVISLPPPPQVIDSIYVTVTISTGAINVAFV